jgi:SAM-dependent methyltransferase
MSGLADEMQTSASDFFEKLYRLVNHQALAPYFSARLHRGGKILDAGSGPGSLARELNLSNACFVDISLDHVKVCRENIGRGIYAQADIGHLPFSDNCFDSVICSNVLHYTGLDGLRELLRVTKGGGQLLLAFLEDSMFTRSMIRTMIDSGLFPESIIDATLIDIHSFMEMGVTIKDSATVVLLPPFFLFRTRKDLPRRGLVIFELEK